MEKQHFLIAIQHALKESKKRKFTQSVDIILNLTGLDMKKDEGKIQTFLKLPVKRKKQNRITALVGQELAVKARNVCDKIVTVDEFKSLEKKHIRKLASTTDFFIGQANIMPQLAATFGRALGPRGKMPSPKAGSIIQPAGEVSSVVEQLRNTVKLETRNEPTIKASMGSEDMPAEALAENALAIYNQILHTVPKQHENIKSVYIKLTMSPAVHVKEDKK